MVNVNGRPRTPPVLCKGCGILFKPGHGVKFCSKECRQKHCGSYVVVANCANCGKQVERKANQIRGVNSCSLECQRQWALNDNRGPGGGKKIDWYSRSKKAKKQWKRASKFQRRLTRSMDYRWWIRAKEESQSLIEKLSISDWDRKCHTAISGMRFRELRQKPKVKRCFRESWNSRFAKVMPNLKGKIAARLRTGWDARCASAYCAIGKRMTD